MNKTLHYWQKNNNSGDWTNRIFMAGRGIGKSTYVQSYINKILQENQVRVLNKKYWPHQLHIPVGTDDSWNSWESINTLERYCYDNFKSANWRNDGRYFWFKRQEDATLFALKWL